MLTNPIIESMLNRKSIRKYLDQMPSDEVLETVVRAGQQAPFASQLCSLLLSRKQEENPFKAPLLFIVCVDSYKWELIMAERNWKMACDDMLLLLQPALKGHVEDKERAMIMICQRLVPLYHRAADVVAADKHIWFGQAIERRAAGVHRSANVPPRVGT